MSDWESRREDARADAYYEKYGEDGCLSDNPYCAKNPRSAGSYESYAGYLCGACEDAIEQDERDMNTVPAGVDDEEA